MGFKWNYAIIYQNISPKTVEVIFSNIKRFENNDLRVGLHLWAEMVDDLTWVELYFAKGIIPEQPLTEIPTFFAAYYKDYERVEGVKFGEYDIRFSKSKLYNLPRLEDALFKFKITVDNGIANATVSYWNQQWIDAYTRQFNVINRPIEIVSTGAEVPGTDTSPPINSKVNATISMPLADGLKLTAPTLVQNNPYQLFYCFDSPNPKGLIYTL